MILAGASASCVVALIIIGFWRVCVSCVLLFGCGMCFFIFASDISLLFIKNQDLSDTTPPQQPAIQAICCCEYSFFDILLFLIGFYFHIPLNINRDNICFKAITA
jgi:hypothetical protein